MRITSKGQITIPVELRELAGLLPGTEVEAIFDGENVLIVKVGIPAKRSRDSRLVSQIRGKGDVPMTTDEIMALTRSD